LDLHDQKKQCPLTEIDVLILDEADRMLDMGFTRDLENLLVLCLQSVKI
jgi:ATP-dependent RNA helicase RhlE